MRDTMIETERLLLRPMVPEDVDPLLRIFTDPLVMAAFDAELFDRGQMQRWVQRNLDHQATTRVSTATGCSR